MMKTQRSLNSSDFKQQKTAREANVGLTKDACLNIHSLNLTFYKLKKKLTECLGGSVC